MSRNKNTKVNNHKNQDNARPNNLLIALLIFGVVAAMFIFVWGYKYYQLSPSIEKYMETIGGDEAFGSMQIDDNSVMSIKAKGNKMTITTNVTSDDEDSAKESYTGKEGKENMEYLAAYYLYSMKTNCRGLSASVKYTVNVNDKKVNSVSLSFREAKKLLKKNGAISE